MAKLMVTFNSRTHEAVREVLILAIGERETDETRDERDARVTVYETALRQMDEPVADVLHRAADMHERHVNLLEGCPLCELEAAHQRDRLACESCGEPLDPSQPFDGHRDCREQE